jgi:gamma-glutamyltranspeptidase
MRLLSGDAADPQAAVAAPRWKIEHKSAGLQLDVEPKFPKSLATGLRALGHGAGPPGLTGDDFGGALVITRDATAPDLSVHWRGGADPRRDGMVAAML